MGVPISMKSLFRTKKEEVGAVCIKDTTGLAGENIEQQPVKIGKSNQKKTQLEVVIIGNGVNIHQKVDFTEGLKLISDTDKNKEYVINDENVLLVSPFLGPKKYMALFKEKGEPIKIEAQSSRITAGILYLAEKSTAMGNAIKEMFAAHFDKKKILFFVIIGIVAAAVYFLVTGGGIRF